MERYHFSEQRFPRICLNKVPIASVLTLLRQMRGNLCSEK